MEAVQFNAFPFLFGILFGGGIGVIFGYVLWGYEYEKRNVNKRRTRPPSRRKV